MKPLPPSLYIGDVGHMRHRPRRHSLRYRMITVLADIDGPHRRAGGTWPFVFDRFGLIGQRAADHGDRSGSLRSWVETVLERHGIALRPGRIQLLAAPRVLGFVFNPVSVYFCHDGEDRLGAVMFEVSNFHGGRHTYAFPVSPNAGTPLRFSCPKAFFVSPFNPVEGEYTFRLDRGADNLRLGIRLHRQGDCVMGAVHTAKRRDLTGANVLHAQITQPFNTVTIVGGILLEALRLRSKGLRVFAPRKGTIDTLPGRL
ncbi:DUF1365 family protein [Maricaulis sp.]|uniref:DUF1365 domain-containing protein n=1 Tax=Maricaulis sp. TaxID=1486257 RepID=UPI0026036A10|nr:DUF1365 family protein [Maricaulis sp.]